MKNDQLSSSYVEALRLRLRAVDNRHPHETMALLNSIKTDSAAKTVLVTDDEDGILVPGSDWSLHVALMIRGLVKEGLLKVSDDHLEPSDLFREMLAAHRALAGVERAAAATENDPSAVVFSMLLNDDLKTALRILSHMIA